MVADLWCNLGANEAVQTIEVGTRPATVDVDEIAGGPSPDLIRSLEGDVPPGTWFRPDGTWSGTATEVGDFNFWQYFCRPDGWCPSRADIRVIVVPAGTGPTDPTDLTDPADPPASAPAAAATPVAGRPALTG